jgi:protein translocase SecG subunit
MNNSVIFSAQIAVSVALILVILLQAKGGGLGTSLTVGQTYHTKRGVEKTFFVATIILGAAFLVLALINAFVG